MYIKYKAEKYTIIKNEKFNENIHIKLSYNFKHIITHQNNTIVLYFIEESNRSEKFGLQRIII